MTISAVLLLASLSAAAPSAASRAAVTTALGEFKSACAGSPAAAVVVDVDLASLAKAYESSSWLRDDSTAYERCAELIGMMAATCKYSRDIVWSGLDERAVESDRTLDLSPLGALKSIRCTTPTYLPALAALVAKNPTWSASDRWTNAAKMHWDDDFRFAQIAPELTMKDGAAVLGLFAGTVNPGELQEKLAVQLVNLEYRRVLGGGTLPERGKFAVLHKWMDKELKQFNEKCGASAKVSVEWQALEAGWPGWDTWVDKARDNVLEDVAVKGFVARVLVDLADLCAHDEDDNYKALQQVKLFRVTADPRGKQVMEVKRQKPKKSLESIQSELFPGTSYLKPSFAWTGDTITYGLWVNVVNPENAREWLAEEITKH